jgi:hypothetical protein
LQNPFEQLTYPRVAQPLVKTDKSRTHILEACCQPSFRTSFDLTESSFDLAIFFTFQRPDKIFQYLALTHLRNVAQLHL